MPTPAVLLAAAWVTAVMSWGWRHRPPPARVASLVAEAGRRRAAPSPVGLLGRWMRRSVGRPPDGRADWRTGWGVLVLGSLLLVSPLVALAAATVVPLLVVLGGRRQRRRSAEAVLASLPETVDLFALAAGSGRPVRAAVAAVAERGIGPVAEELRLASRRIALGERVTDALNGVSSALGDPVDALITALVTSELEGTPLVPALERLAVEARLDRRRRAEEAARRVPVKLLFPLVCCTLPAFALLTVVPLLVGALGSLRL